MSAPASCSRRSFLRTANAALGVLLPISLLGCSDVPEAGTVDTRAAGVMPNRVRGKKAGSEVSNEPDPPAKGGRPAGKKGG